MVLALIAIAVGDELAIAHPGDEPTLGFAILTFGGTALFLLAQVAFLHEAFGDVPRSRALGLAALAILAPHSARPALVAPRPLSPVALEPRARAFEERGAGPRSSASRASKSKPLSREMRGSPRRFASRGPRSQRSAERRPNGPNRPSRRR
jgi:hypothetical protein